MPVGIAGNIKTDTQKGEVMQIQKIRIYNSL